MKWEQSKTGTRATVKLEDLEIAARSEGYASQRDTAALLRQQRATGRMADSKRADLWCPIQSACKLASRVAIEKAQDIEREALVLEAVRSQTPRTELQKPLVDSAAPSAPVRKKRTKGPDIDQMLAQYASDRGIDDAKKAQSSP